jgi:hypothetical protein
MFDFFSHALFFTSLRPFSTTFRPFSINLQPSLTSNFQPFLLFLITFRPFSATFFSIFRPGFTILDEFFSTIPPISDQLQTVTTNFNNFEPFLTIFKQFSIKFDHFYPLFD